MWMRLLSYGLFNLAGNVLDFSCILFSPAISLQIRVVGHFPGLLLDCAFDFVKLAGCLIFCAWFHHDFLLCSLVAFGSLKSVAACLPDAEPCIDQYRTIGLVIAGRNCSQRTERQGGQTHAGLGKRLSETHQPIAVLQLV